MWPSAIGAAWPRARLGSRPADTSELRRSTAIRVRSTRQSRHLIGPGPSDSLRNPLARNAGTLGDEAVRIAERSESNGLGRDQLAPKGLSGIVRLRRRVAE